MALVFNNIANGVSTRISISTAPKMNYTLSPDGIEAQLLFSIELTQQTALSDQISPSISVCSWYICKVSAALTKQQISACKNRNYICLTDPEKPHSLFIDTLIRAGNHSQIMSPFSDTELNVVDLSRTIITAMHVAFLQNARLDNIFYQKIRRIAFHEMGHALIAKRNDFTVTSITVSSPINSFSGETKCIDSISLREALKNTILLPMIHLGLVKKDASPNQTTDNIQKITTKNLQVSLGGVAAEQLMLGGLTIEGFTNQISRPSSDLHKARILAKVILSESKSDKTPEDLILEELSTTRNLLQKDLHLLKSIGSVLAMTKKLSGAEFEFLFRCCGNRKKEAFEYTGISEEKKDHLVDILHKLNLTENCIV